MSGVAPTTPPELLGSRSSRLLGRYRPGGRLVALASTVLVFGVLGYLIVTAQGHVYAFGDASSGGGPADVGAGPSPAVGAGRVV